MKKTINLRQKKVFTGKREYAVIKLVNSTEYSINQTLKESDVKDLIHAQWTVNITG